MEKIALLLKRFFSSFKRLIKKKLYKKIKKKKLTTKTTLRVADLVISYCWVSSISTIYLYAT